MLKSLESEGFYVISEPVETVWGQYIPQLYADIKRWGFCFQLEVIDWFRQLYHKELNNNTNYNKENKNMKKNYDKKLFSTGR